MVNTIKVCHDCPLWDYCKERIGGERHWDCPAPHLSQKPVGKEGNLEGSKAEENGAAEIEPLEDLKGGNKMFKAGDKLNNGATVMAAKPKEGYHIVLAEWNDLYCRFVTWAVDKNGDAYWGHYFDNQEKAMENFLKR